MSASVEHFSPDKKKLDKIAGEILKPVGFSKSFMVWMTFLVMVFLICGYAYSIQLKEGLIVTGMRDFVSWGMYIANFVFFVAVSLVGMLISAVLGLIGYKWIKPIARIAEIVAVGFATIAGLVIVVDMGRPDRVDHVFLYGRVQSPILWDVTVITTYMTISLLLYFLPLIPDLAIAKGRMKNAPKWLVNLYEILSLKWNHSSQQFKILMKSLRILLILVVPTAFGIHTVTSWLFAATSRSGWDSTIFGPYFLTGAFVAGTAAVIILMYFYRNNYKFDKYLTDEHFDKMGKLLVLTSLVYFYFNINEFLVPALKMKRVDSHHLHALFAGKYAVMFYMTQIGGLILPMILMMFKPFRKPGLLTFLSILVLLGAWFKRYIIVIPTMEHPNLPIQGVPEAYMVYSPTVIEVAVTLMTFVMSLMIITILSKVFPIIPIWEMVEEAEENEKLEEAIVETKPAE